MTQSADLAEATIHTHTSRDAVTRHDFSRQRWHGFLWAGLSVLIFSGWFVVTRLSVTRELRLWDVTALRFGIGALVLSPVLLKDRKKIPAKAWIEGLVYACLWGLPFVLAVAFGLQITSARRAAAITPALMPVFAGVFAWITLRESQGARRWGGYLAIIVGLTCLTLSGDSMNEKMSPLGLSALVVAAAMWATYTLLFRRSELTPVQSAALICFWSSAIFLPIYILGGFSLLAHASAQEIILQAVYQGLLMSGVAIVAFNRSVTLLGPSSATAIIALIPAAASLTAIPILGERPNIAEGIAIACVVIGVLFVARSSRSTLTRTSSPPQG